MLDVYCRDDIRLDSCEINIAAKRMSHSLNERRTECKRQNNQTSNVKVKRQSPSK